MSEAHPSAVPQYENVWIVTEYDGGGIRGLFISQTDAEAEIAAIRAEYPDLTRSDFSIQVHRVRRLAASASSSTARPNRFDCSTCGPAIAVDEDGCCRTCGRDAKTVISGSIVSSPQDAQEPPDMDLQTLRSERLNGYYRYNGEQFHAGYRAAIADVANLRASSSTSSPREGREPK